MVLTVNFKNYDGTILQTLEVKAVDGTWTECTDSWINLLNFGW